jgi:hypothetical protein
MRPLTGLAAQAVLMPHSGIERLFTLFVVDLVWIGICASNLTQVGS